MTDHRDIDEIASALLDGLLPPEEAAAVARNPVVAARLEELRIVTEALRDVPEPTATARDDAIAVALTAFDATAAEDNRTATSAAAPGDDRRPVTHLGPRRAGRFVPPRWLGAAAVVLVLAIAAGLLAWRDGGDHEDMASDAPSAADSEEGSREAAGGASTTESGGDESSQGGGTAAPPVDLGSADDVATLRADARARLSELDAGGEGEATTPEEGDGGSGPDTLADQDLTALVPARDPDVPCPGLHSAGDPGRGRVILAATARYRDEPVAIHIYEAAGVRRLVATDADCTDVVDVPLDG